MYLTVINQYTGKPVPFLTMSNGEIKIMSTNPEDNDENCIVTLTNKFYYTSQEFHKGEVEWQK